MTVTFSPRPARLCMLLQQGLVNIEYTGLGFATLTGFFLIRLFSTVVVRASSKVEFERQTNFKPELAT